MTIFSIFVQIKSIETLLDDNVSIIFHSTYLEFVKLLAVQK